MSDLTGTTTDDLPAIGGDELWSLQEFADWLRARWPGQRGLTYRALLERRDEFAHIQIGKAFLLSAEQRRAFIATYTRQPAKPRDPLDATRDRIARERARKAAPSQRRTAA